MNAKTFNRFAFSFHEKPNVGTVGFGKDIRFFILCR